MSSSSWGRNAKNASIWDHSRLMIKLDCGIIHERESLFLSVITLSWTIYRMWRSLTITNDWSRPLIIAGGWEKKINLPVDLTLWKQSLFRTGQGLCVLQHMEHLATGDLCISYKFIFFLKIHTHRKTFFKRIDWELCSHTSVELFIYNLIST